MAGPQFVVRYLGEGSPPEADLARIKGLPGLTAVEETPAMLLVETDPQPLRDLVADLPNWMMAPNQIYAVPDLRQQVEGPPGDEPTD